MKKREESSRLLTFPLLSFLENPITLNTILIRAYVGIYRDSHATNSQKVVVLKKTFPKKKTPPPPVMAS